MTERLHVLVVDDSALVRQTMTAILTQDGFDVTIAADPLIARERIRTNRPDVVLLDLEMPRMDGLSFLRELMTDDHPLPVVICSAFAGRGSEKALRALAEGAVDVLAKPQLGVRDFLYESAVVLHDVVRAAAAARVRRHARVARVELAPPRVASASTTDRIIAIGASTGGPEALRVVLSSLDETAPGVVVVQHMPRYFTGAFAQSLDRECRIRVREAKSGDVVANGTALIAPGDAHLLVHRAANGYSVAVADGPLVSRHRPSVDVLFRSVARAAGARATAVLLTGMGDDGAAGLLELRNAGAMTIAQDEATSVVFGMPKEAITRGAAAFVLPLPDIAARLGAATG